MLFDHSMRFCDFGGWQLSKNIYFSRGITNTVAFFFDSSLMSTRFIMNPSYLNLNFVVCGVVSVCDVNVLIFSFVVFLLS